MNCWIWNIDKDKKNYIQKEIEEGRLRQGWSYIENLNLKILRNKKDKNIDFTKKEKRAWKRCKWMLTKIQPEDLIVVKNIPDSNSFTLVKVKGEYYFSLDKEQGDQGHILPINKIQTFNKNSRVIPAPFINAINREQHPIRRTLKHKETVINLSQQKISDEKAKTPEEFKEMLEGSRIELLKPLQQYLKDKLTPKLAEKLILNMIIRDLNEDHKLDYTAGPKEQGADMIAEFDFGWLFSNKIAIQVKMRWGKDKKVDGVNQLKQAMEKYNVEAGMLISFANKIGKKLKKEIKETKKEYNIEILYGQQLYKLLLETIVDPDFEILEEI